MGYRDKLCAGSVRECVKSFIEEFLFRPLLQIRRIRNLGNRICAELLNMMVQIGMYWSIVPSLEISSINGAPYLPK